MVGSTYLVARGTDAYCTGTFIFKLSPGLVCQSHISVSKHSVREMLREMQVYVSPPEEDYGAGRTRIHERGVFIVTTLVHLE